MTTKTVSINLSFYAVADAFLGVALSIILLFSASSAQGQSQAGDSWQDSSLSFRREITLPADTDGSRDEAPVLLDLTEFGDPVDLDSIRVFEVTDTATEIEASAYAEETGDGPRLYFTAPDTTAQDAERYFHVYYNKTSSWDEYSYSWRSGASFGGDYEIEQLNTKYFYYLSNDRVELKRGARNKLTSGDGDPQQGAFYEVNPDGEDFSHFTDLSDSFSPFNGFRVSYALRDPLATSEINFNVSGEERSFNYVHFDRNGPTASFGVQYDVAQDFDHRIYLSHRLFKDKPLLELTLTAEDSSGDPLQFARDYFNSRQFYWKDSFSPSRMDTDLMGDENYHSDSTVKTWHILYENTSEAMGVFTFEPSDKQHWNNLQRLMDYLQLAAKDTNTLRVYYAIGSVDEIKEIFTTFKRGYDIGNEQQQSFDIVSPEPGAHFAYGETIEVYVDGDAMPADLTLTVTYPDASTESFSSLDGSSTGSSSAKLFSLGTAGGNGLYGEWTLTASGDGIGRSMTIDVYAFDSPRGVFSQAEYAAAQARWPGDSRYTTHIEAKLLDKAESYYAKGSVPSSGDQYSSTTVRDYGRRLLSYASVLLMDSSYDLYRTRMWSDFDTMINWERLAPFENEVEVLRTADVSHGEILEKLALTFDWGMDELSVEQRREYAEKLFTAAESLLEIGLADPYPVRWNNNNWIHNNRFILQNAGVAVALRVTEPFISEERSSFARQRLEDNWESLIGTLADDGSDNSGFSYTPRTNFSLLLWAETRRLDGDASAYDAPWFDNCSEYDLYAMIPGQGMNLAGVIPFGNGEETPYESQQMVSALFAERKDDAIAQWIAENSDYVRVGELQPIWLDYSHPEQSLDEMPNWHCFEDRGIFVFRSDWSTDAMYFTVKCGEFWGGHEHPDLGSFYVFKDGLPYIAPSHYLNNATNEDENIMLFNDTGQRGLSADDAYSVATESKYWGSLDSSLGSPDYFNVVANPAPAYESDADLVAYTREFVGFDDMIFMRENAQTNSNATFKQMLHAYRTYPAGEEDGRYNHYQYPTETAIVKMGPGRYNVYPNQSVYPNLFMTITDRSNSSFSTSIVDWHIVPEKVPGYLPSGTTRSDNSSDMTYQIGQTLQRTANGLSEATSLQILHFEDLNIDAWSDSAADDGAIAHNGDASANAIVKVAWPSGGSLNGSTDEAQGLETQASMVFRHYDLGLVGGRELTVLEDHSSQGEGDIALIEADHPVDIVSTFADGGNEAWVTTTQQTHLKIYAPGNQFNLLLIDDGHYFLTKNSNYVEFDLGVVDNAHLEAKFVNSANGAWGYYQ